MAFTGYFRYDNVEIVNNDRLSAYVDHLNIGFFKCEDMCPTLQEAISSFPRQPTPDNPSTIPVRPLWDNGMGYTIPQSPTNPAPWWDAVEVPEAGEFAGVHILDITNVDSSTYGATAQESINNGGSVNRGRYRTREIVVRALLVGSTLRGCRYGFNWLSMVLKEGDPCRKNVKVRHTYGDFLPYNKPWWVQYKRDDPTPIGDNVFQAAWYTGIATGPLDTDGNTYAAMSHSENGGPDLEKDALDILLPLEAVPLDITEYPSCGGHRLEFFVQCPDAATVEDEYRYIIDTYLTAGPIILSEHELGVNCDNGAWYEIEFTLTAANPFVWRLPVDITAVPAMFSYLDIEQWWLYYKDELDLPIDDDLYQAPLVATEPHTYSGLISTMWERHAAMTPIVRAGGPSARPLQVPEIGSIIITDPDCPPLPTFPAIPQEDFNCRPIYAGSYKSQVYAFQGSTLPRYSPAAFTIRFTTILDATFKDLQIRIVPESGSAVKTNVIEFHVLYIPPASTLLIDGVRRSIDIRTGDPFDASSWVWSPAEHLVLSHGAASAYSYPEITCGRDASVIIDIPTTSPFTFDQFNLDIAVSLRDA